MGRLGPVGTHGSAGRQNVVEVAVHLGIPRNAINSAGPRGAKSYLEEVECVGIFTGWESREVLLIGLCRQAVFDHGSALD